MFPAFKKFWLSSFLSQSIVLSLFLNLSLRLNIHMNYDLQEAEEQEVNAYQQPT